MKKKTEPVPLPEEPRHMQKLLHDHWQPKSIVPPTVDPELGSLTGIQRSAEVIRYRVLSLEYWLSPLGRLREWIRLNTMLSVILLVPTILVLPLVSWMIWMIAGWLTMLVGVAGNLILLPIVVLLAAGSIAVAVTVLKAILGK